MSNIEDYRFSKDDEVEVKVITLVNGREVDSSGVTAEAKVVLVCQECGHECDPDTFVQHVLERHAP